MLGLILIIVSALVLVAWLLSIDMFINVGKAKGYSMANSGKLWFIGIVATPLVVGLYVAALPDNRKIVFEQASGQSSKPTSDDDALPEV